MTVSRDSLFDVVYCIPSTRPGIYGSTPLTICYNLASKESRIPTF